MSNDAAARSVLVSELSDDLVTEHLQWMLDGAYAPDTANSARGHVVALWRLAHKKGLVEKLPGVDKLPVPKQQPKAWSVDELGRILESCREQPGEIRQIPAADWWRAFILTLYDTGLRRRAASLIERTHVNLDDGWLFVPAEHQKQNAEQQLRLHSDSVEAIRQIWLPERKLLFAFHREENRVWRIYGEILNRAGLPSGPKDKFHKIRRTTATHIAAAAGVAAASHQLGHSSEAMTKRYIDPRFIQSRDATDFLPRPKGSAQ